jgi:hypothetical protein
VLIAKVGKTFVGEMSVVDILAAYECNPFFEIDRFSAARRRTASNLGAVLT